MDLRDEYRKPTMKDVAESAGVSISTVSHVLNGTRFVSTEVAAKVQEAIHRLQFKANPIARNLRSGESRLIGFVVSNMESYFYVNIAKGIEKELSALNYQLMLIDSAETKKTEMKNIESLYVRGADGIIVAPTTTDCGYLKNLLPPDFPLVFVDRQPANYPADSVLLNNAEASGEATRYLLKKGYTRIGFVSFHFGGTTIDETIMERIDGYKQAFRGAGLEVNPDYIRAVPSTSLSIHKLLYAESYQIMKELLGASIQGVICGNSLSAIGVFTCLREAAIRIPEEVALITFDDDLWLSMTNPSITAVVQPAQSMGSRAATRLLQRMQEKQLPYESLRLKANILFRESC
ncbi:MAG: LacI family transcriptional regulator [Treponema sp.]|nr:LacI family transcriptional regulator [Treponema sp.]